ncbi:hypothetical protein [Apis mellifera associated microvirus 56]|nr:hypothetical protein [Apis mellifera associated microvirus 56]
MEKGGLQASLFPKHLLNMDFVTHETEEEFLSTFDDQMEAVYRFFFVTPNTHAVAIKNLLEQVWDKFPELRPAIATVSNDYWRQFTFSLDFADLHIGQQVHVLRCLYNCVISYINTQNESASSQNFITPQQ